MAVRPIDFRRIAEPEAEPVSVEEAREHLKVTDEKSEASVGRLIAQARAYVEGCQERALITQTWEAQLDGFWGCEDLELPKPPLQDVEITYFDAAGAERTLGTDVYEVDTRAQPGRVRLKPDQSWPSTQVRRNAVTVRFTCGHGDAAEDVPAETRGAVLLVLGHLERNPQAVVTGTIATELPLGARSLIELDAVPWPD